MDRRRQPILFLLTAAFALRGLFLILALPIGDPLDELFHFGYAEYVAATGRIPREADASMPVDEIRITALLPRSTGFGGPRLGWKQYIAMPRAQQRRLRREAMSARRDERGRFLGTNYETQQPPAMYALAALPLRALAGAPVNARLFAARSLALAAATCAVPLAYVFFRKLFPKRSALAATLALVAFPGLGTFTSRFTNDSLALPIAAALLGLLADAARGRLSKGKTVALALLLAAGSWTKLYFLVFLPAASAAACLSPRRRRAEVLRHAAAASLAGFLLIIPWLARQHADTGDWLGLTETKAAGRAGVGILPRLAAIPRVVRGGFLRTLGSTFIYPGTWASMGATGLAAALAVVGIAILGFLPLARIGGASRARRRAWAGAAAALAVFLAAQIAHAATFAASPDGSSGAGGEGWYLLILAPVVIAAGAARGMIVGPRSFVAAAALFVLSEAICTFGRLAAVYAGFTSPRLLLFSPKTCFGVFSRVGLVSLPGPALAAIAAGSMLFLIAAAFFLLAPARDYERLASRSPKPVSTSARAASSSGAR